MVVVGDLRQAGPSRSFRVDHADLLVVPALFAPTDVDYVGDLLRQGPGGLRGAADVEDALLRAALVHDRESVVGRSTPAGVSNALAAMRPAGPAAVGESPPVGAVGVHHPDWRVVTEEDVGAVGDILFVGGRGRDSPLLSGLCGGLLGGASFATTEI